MPTLILLRHGQSQWNLENRFTGWVDVDLTDEGEAQAKKGGELIKAAGLQIDRAYTSVQTRAIRTLWLALAAAGQALPFATVSALDGRVLGSTRFANLERWSWPAPPPDPRPLDAAEIGWTWLARAAQRSGANTEAKLLLLRHAFTALRVRRLTLKTDARNARSRAAIARLGASLDGVLRAHLPASDGGPRDSAVFSILEAEWPAVEARLVGMLRR